jgi:hypothetical protein
MVIIGPEDIDCGYEGDEAEAISFQKIEHQTDNAVLFIIDGEKVWIPKSVIQMVEHDNVVWVATWFVEKEM